MDRVKKYDTVVSSGQSALRAFLTMDGGAIIVLLTLLGHLWDDSKHTLTRSTLAIFVVALSWYIAATFFALLSYCAIFVTNCFSSVNWRRSSGGAFVVTLLFGFGSLVSFLIGSCQAIAAFRSISMS